MSPSPDPETPATLNSKKRPGRPSSFTPEQLGLIEAYFPEWKQLLIDNNLQYGKEARKLDPKPVKDWLAKTIDAVYGEPAFRNLDMSSKNEKAWKKSIHDVFKNHRNNKLVSGNLKQLRDERVETMEVGCEERRMRAEKGFKVIADFQRGPRTAKQIFLDEEAEDIHKHALKLLEEDPLLNGCNAGANTRASTELWGEANQSVYEEKARKEADVSNVLRNRDNFAKGLHATLKAVATNGILGNVEFCVLLASRNADNEVSNMFIEVSSEPSSQKFMKDDPSGIRESFETAWCKWAQEKIKPNCPKPTMDERIPRNLAGVPILSGVSFEKASPETTREVLDNFLTVLWYRASGQKDVPYESIVNQPSDYYDTEAFILPVSLGHPQHVTQFHLYGLLDFFTRRDPSDPFVFRTVSRGVSDQTMTHVDPELVRADRAEPNPRQTEDGPSGVSGVQGIVNVQPLQTATNVDHRQVAFSPEKSQTDASSSSPSGKEVSNREMVKESAQPRHETVDRQSTATVEPGTRVLEQNGPSATIPTPPAAPKKHKVKAVKPRSSNSKTSRKVKTVRTDSTPEAPAMAEPEAAGNKRKRSEASESAISQPKRRWPGYTSVPNEEYLNKRAEALFDVQTPVDINAPRATRRGGQR
ncbi:hypothetical protein AAF712_003403 [Marasmius tenuissimus]|uniref:Uncharacterized protein n=1 Tax=Marasmius tenuissimus TaxID=585030 RepID=A0ABR3A793_9AGAR